MAVVSLMIPDEIRSTHIADALDGLGLAPIGGGGFRSVATRGRLVVGRAYTIQQRLASRHVQPDLPKPRHIEAITELAGEGDILVIGVAGGLDAATWGEAHAMRTLVRGISGVVIDGALRDADSLDALGLPMLFRSATPFRSIGRMETVALGTEADIGGVTVRTGDIVAFDGDGFIAIAPDDWPAVLSAAHRIALSEAERDGQLLAKVTQRRARAGEE